MRAYSSLKQGYFEMWFQLKLKADEATYFFEQLRAHTRQPRLFLYYLSAFLTSARSVTFHLQKQFTHNDPGKVYDTLRQEMLSDKVCDYFIDLRNEVEKRGYPSLVVKQIVERKGKDSDKSVWYELGAFILFGEQDDESGLDFLERLLRHEWELVSLSGPPTHIVYRWFFPDYPSGEKDVVVACENFNKRLWQFLVEFRARWEKINDPKAWDKKFDVFIGHR
jgi:hypothetical protein